MQNTRPIIDDEDAGIEAIERGGKRGDLDVLHQPCDLFGKTLEMPAAQGFLMSGILTLPQA
jgi:hypothetical protein